MNQLSENCLRYIFSIDNTLRMIYSVECVVQVIESKDDGDKFFNLTVSDGINFKANFLTNRKKKFKIYDIIRIESIMRSSPKDSRNVIFIFKSSLISDDVRNIIGSPVEFPKENNPHMKNINRINPTKNEEKKQEKKLQIKVQRITLKRTNENIESFSNRENKTSDSFIESKLIKNFSLENSKLNLNESFVKEQILKAEKVFPEISGKGSPKKNYYPDDYVIKNRDSNDKKKDYSEEIQLDKTDIEKIIEINENEQIVELKLTQEFTESQTLKNTQEVRLTQVIDQSEIIKNIQEINQIEELKDTNNKEKENKNNSLKSQIENLNNKFEQSNNFIDEISPTALITQIQDQLLYFPNDDTISENKPIKRSLMDSNDNNSNQIKLFKNQSEGHFRMSIPERHVMRSLPTKSLYQHLTEIQDQTKFTIRVRIIQTYQIKSSCWNLKIIDEKENYGVLTVPNILIEKYRNILKIYDTFEIVNGESSKQLFHNVWKFFYVPITITKDTVVTKLNNNYTSIKLLEEEYTKIEDIKNLRSNVFTIMGYITHIEEKKYFIDKNGKDASVLNFFIIDFSQSKIKLAIYNDAQNLKINEGDVIFVSNPIVNRKLREECLVISNFTIVFVNPNCPTALKLKKNFESNSIEVNGNLSNNQIVIRKFKLLGIENFVKSEDFNLNQIFIIKATIESFNPKSIQFISLCPLCSNMLKICIEDAFNCQRCNTNMREQDAKITVRLSIDVQDCTGKRKFYFLNQSSTKFINYVFKKNKIKEISMEEIKKLIKDYNKDIYVKEFEQMMSFLKKSEFFFKIKINISGLNENITSKSKNKNIYFNVKDFWPVEKKKERENSVVNIKNILGIK